MRNQNDTAFLVMSQDELRGKVYQRLKLGQDLIKLAIHDPEKKKAWWTDFIDWDDYNLELLRQTFNDRNNPYSNKSERHS